MVNPEKNTVPNKYYEAYEDLRRKDPIASMDETTTEYPSKDYRQIDQMLEERKNLRDQTPRRELDNREYQPRRLMQQDRIELDLPKSSKTPHRDTALHGIYPIPEDEGEKKSSQNNLPLVVVKTHPGRRGLQRSIKIQIHSQAEARAQGGVLELPEGEEETGPVILVTMKDLMEI